MKQKRTASSLEVKGVMISETEGRVYPLGAAGGQSDWLCAADQCRGTGRKTVGRVS